ncbi:hypothetical protein BO71DRAFT_141087 [Aspergillus ellipticus CBS 707.79]|uniref:Uncharacterized protein n=1 Tax=Aspergillus ellipticus CBS 707.79 TaxID=1448320 RepID=A0A319CUY6_9EURO|nr:hypothetical protein BO71DRAFT_141087 [Aspergillus ellipticus CBS 707.79]
MHYYPNIGKSLLSPFVFSVQKKKKKKKKKNKRKKKKGKKNGMQYPSQQRKSSGVYDQKCFTKNAAKRRLGSVWPCVSVPI